MKQITLECRWGGWGNGAELQVLVGEDWVRVAQVYQYRFSPSYKMFMRDQYRTPIGNGESPDTLDEAKRIVEQALGVRNVEAEQEDNR